MPIFFKNTSCKEPHNHSFLCFSFDDNLLCKTQTIFRNIVVAVLLTVIADLSGCQRLLQVKN